MIMKRFANGFGLKQKLILAFSIFVVVASIVLSAVSMVLFSRKLEEKNNLYISDIHYQTVNNLEMTMSYMEEITFSVLSSAEIQDHLRLLNQPNLSATQLLLSSKAIEKALSIHTLYNDNIISLSVFTDGGLEVVSRSIQLEPTKSLYDQEALYTANGSALWGLINDSDKDICVARAILDLKTQKPIGSINLVFRREYIGDIMSDITISYASGSYILDRKGLVISSNLTDTVGETTDILEGHAERFATYEREIEGVPCFVYKGKEMTGGWVLATIIPQNELRREAGQFMSVIAVLDLAVILVVIATVWALVRKITSPFDRLCRSMEEVGQGNFEKRELIETSDEIGMLSRSYNEMVDNIETLIEQVYKLEISKRQAELEFLKMQINPHFLYNTLDTISWMARIERKDDIAEVTIALASLLRANIKQDDFITIAREMENIHNYLLIQKYRFSSKLSWRILVEPECEGYFIPSFILQPLVENAIIHGLEPKQQRGKLAMSIKLEEGFLKFVVADDGVGMDPDLLQALQDDMLDETSRASIGLKNADRRLRLQFGEDAALFVESDPGIGTRIRFHIPVEKCVRPPGQFPQK